MKLTYNIANALVEYDPSAGAFTWRARQRAMFTSDARCAAWNTRYAGKATFKTRCPQGYLRGHILGVRVAAHRLAWLLVHKEWPKAIDHIDGRRDNNRLENLRNVNQAVNTRNASLRSDNTSGHSGVTMHRTGKWRAHVYEGGRFKHLGLFESLDEAVAVRRRALASNGFSPRHGEPRP